MGLVLVQHDPGCQWGRVGARARISPEGKVLGELATGYGHTDAAKRFSDTYNLHRAAGTGRGWIAVAYADGTGGREVYDDRAAAVLDCFPYEDRYFYCSLAERQLTVCAAESVLRFKRIMRELERPDRDVKGGGLEVIPRLATEDQEAQIRAVRTGRGYVAMGHRKDPTR